MTKILFVSSNERNQNASSIYHVSSSGDETQEDQPTEAAPSKLPMGVGFRFFHLVKNTSGLVRFLSWWMFWKARECYSVCVKVVSWVTGGDKLKQDNKRVKGL